MKGLSPKLWEKLMVLSQTHRSIRLDELSQEIGLGQEETVFFLKQILPVEACMRVFEDQGTLWINLNSEAMEQLDPLSPQQWKSIQKNLATSGISETALSEGPLKVIMELLRELDQWDQHLDETHHQMVKTLDRNIEEKETINIALMDGKMFLIHPWKVLHLDGHLALIGEDTEDHCLMVVAVKEIQEITIISSCSKAKASVYEVEEFIKALRSMSENETRLILKIFDPQTNNLFPDHHFLGKPCMITNPFGDLIWAAYVEPGEDLYEWLLTLGSNVEILDPVTFKDDYLAYCEEKLKKVA